ncbi:DNA-binding protein [Klebsiella pneumoniae]|nr:DNA-binding protein [Klebsiella pneumoniae]
MPLDSLIKSPLNVRTVPYSAESVSELADSIKGVGLLQNLVVHALPGDRYGVSPQAVADWQHSTCWQSATSFRLTGLYA